MNPRHIGGSLLPSGGPDVYRSKRGAHGDFETRPLPDLDTHGLFYARNSGDYAGQFILVAMHPNGYSCDELAKRILAAWESGKPERALQQADYILKCGGLSKDTETMRRLAQGDW